MAKWILSTTLVSAFLLQSGADAWGQQKGPMYDGSTEGETNVYLNKNDNPNYFLHGANENAFFRVNYLYWRPTEGDMDFTTKNTNPFGFSPQNPQATITLKEPHFSWSSGARATLGIYMPNYDLWDLSFTTTFFYSDASNELSFPVNADTILTPTFFVGVLGDFSNKGSAAWKMNFFIFDLSIGREYFLSEKITAHPFLGGRGIILDQDYNVRFRSAFLDSLGSTVITDDKTKMTTDNDIAAVGLHLGSDIAFQLPSHFSIIGNLSGSLLYGTYNMQQKVVSGRIHPLLQAYHPKLKNHDHQLFSNIEGSIGLKWERWLNKGNNRFALSASVEGQEWFDINKWFNMDQTELFLIFPTFKPSSRHGNLGIFAYNFALQFDF